MPGIAITGKQEQKMKCIVFAVLLTLAATSSFAAEGPGELRVGRYTTVAEAPPEAQSNPLDAVVVLSFPRNQVKSVKDAISYLLIRTGYRLTDTEQLGPEVMEILALPLAEVHRKIGPYSVRSALSVLLGTPFTLSTDPVRRQIAYTFDSTAPARVAQEPVPIVPVADVTASTVPAPVAIEAPSGVRVFPLSRQ
jgi:type IV pili sensor histidine kinase/response regulator